MGGKSQSEAVNILRNTKYGAVVNFVVSRQVDEVITDPEEPDKFALPRELVTSLSIYQLPVHSTSLCNIVTKLHIIKCHSLLIL